MKKKTTTTTMGKHHYNSSVKFTCGTNIKNNKENNKNNIRCEIKKNKYIFLKSQEFVKKMFFFSKV